ncbi:MAG: transglutaminaseTgpA domain-containing protein, partial [Burkholderiaceae bacterium]
MPREARDTLFLLGVIGWTVLPHAAHLPAWCGWLTLAVLLWRARLAVRGAALPGRWVLIAVLLIAAGLTLMSYRTLLGKEPGVTLLVALMALKTLELRARRDAFVVFFLGFFIVLTHFLYSQSLAVAIAMLVSVWGLLTALVLAHMPVGQPSLRQAGLLAARTAALGAPIMV